MEPVYFGFVCSLWSDVIQFLLFFCIKQAGSLCLVHFHGTLEFFHSVRILGFCKLVFLMQGANCLFEATVATL